MKMKLSGSLETLQRSSAFSRKSGNPRRALSNQRNRHNMCENSQLLNNLKRKSTWTSTLPMSSLRFCWRKSHCKGNEIRRSNFNWASKLPERRFIHEVALPVGPRQRRRSRLPKSKWGRRPLRRRSPSSNRSAGPITIKHDEKSHSSQWLGSIGMDENSFCTCCHIWCVARSCPVRARFLTHLRIRPWYLLLITVFWNRRFM